ncbi:MAG: hypothetical protein KR126chlam4_00777 [Candidatus Anoxychlamydiales bacterium]|nr:hypothetical protein [Candidatus Anoxychlamydiales bacterium]NGX40946.1 hypothetical protein [Candidatus Anoxychlamydiales bacterium]HEU63937.1 hypothetical protein [Chlamydiota bacterium]
MTMPASAPAPSRGPTGQEILQNMDGRIRDLEQNQGSTASSQGSATQREPRSNPMPATITISKNGKAKVYEIIIKSHGEQKNATSDVSQRFATLFGMTLQYGIAALLHQHDELKEEDIKLKHVKIKKKAGDDGELFLRYKDKENGKKYKVQITDDLKIKGNVDEGRIAKDTVSQRDLDTAYKTHEAAIEIIEKDLSYGSKENNQVGNYTLKIPNSLSRCAEEFLDKADNKHVKDLKSRGNDASSNGGIAKKIKEKKAKEISDDDELGKSGRTSTKTKGAKDANTEEKKASDPKLKSPVKADALDERLNPLTISKEENRISKIPDIRKEDLGLNWKNYLLRGILTKPRNASKTLKRRSVKPKEFEDEKAIEILSKFIKNEPLSLDSFNDDNGEKVFLKRLLLLLNAYADKEGINEYDENTLKARFGWIATSSKLFFQVSQAAQDNYILGLGKNAQNIFNFINPLLEKIKTNKSLE